MGRAVSFRVEGRAPEGAAGAPLRLALGDAAGPATGAVPRGRWLRLRYAANLYEDPVRPVIRFLRPGGHEDALMPGPVLGRATWLGLVPDDALAVELRPGTASFRLESVEVVTGAALLARCLLRRPGRFVTALFFLARGNARRFRDTLRGALTTAPLAGWEAFAAPRRRGLDPGLDRPRAAGDGPPILLVIAVPAGAAAAAAATLASLRAQGHGAWRAALVGPGAAEAASEVAPGDPRAVRLAWPEGAPAAEALAPLLGPGPAALWVLAAGDRLAPEALALLADRLARPGTRLVYADEEVPGPSGVTPRLKPAWSPDLALVSDLVGRPALHVGTDLLAEVSAGSPAALEAELALAAALQASPGSVHHLARVLLRRGSAPAPEPSEARHRRLTAGLARAGSPALAAVEDGRVALTWPLPAPPPLVSVVVPSRDRLDLIARCVRGVLHETAYPAIELVVVDNDSRDPAVLRFYEDLAADARARVLPWPGAFDFAAMVNDGVAASRGAIVLLLNNDTVVLHPDWLAQMVRQACRPEVGAVGARLLYADGTLQHAGVVVGLGGRAGHVLRRRPADSPGHLGQMRVAHEVSAVTAACLAVDRAKYGAVGGLDAEAFPIDFNDVDLCLRLAARGWKTVWTPRATLSHLESISRGPALGPARARFEAEAARFGARWDATIRDDPFYHPALSATTFGEDLE